MKAHLVLVFFLCFCSFISGFEKVQYSSGYNWIYRYVEHASQNQAFKDVFRKNGIKSAYDSQDDAVKIEVVCRVCNTLADTILEWLNSGLSRDELLDKTVQLCITGGFITENVCYGIIDGYIDMFMWLADWRTKEQDPVTGKEFCGLALYPTCPINEQRYNWTLDLSFMGPKPGYYEPPLPPAEAPTIKVLQLSDVHIDQNYAPGGNAECNEPTCCRTDQGEPERPEATAGYWGDYRDCDMPVHAFRDMVENAAQTYSDVAYVMFTGDVVDHGVWATTTQGNMDNFKIVMEEIRNQFPSVPLLPILGNHEPHPLNAYSSGDWSDVPLNISTIPTYELAAQTWGAWLPGIETTVSRGGYYSYAVHPDLLVIALNNNICYTQNWWLMYDSVDPAGQLVWLAKTLQIAETYRQKVHILSHLSPTSSGCLPSWRNDYKRILDRFANTITAQFYGHTHKDLFEVFYDSDFTGLANNLAFSGGSGTPYSDVNSNYKVYTIQGLYSESYFIVLDFVSRYYNLTNANLQSSTASPEWKQLYSFSDAYEVSSLSPSAMDGLVKRMAADTSLQEQYFRFSVKEGDSSLQNGCDRDCLKDLICEIVANTPNKCEELPWPTV